ncbi:glycosyltransferase [Clostridium botulinum]|uniref:glycosyltransferase n=1 Tax=Clostridium botulinum TaxID=1491 RepID=UPI000D12706C|nr:glycosyltransferase [Clostridium botulinum]AVQ44382.1 glycosyl transferase [Clostridium botulinum]AVQ47925.1 glycosyl transferase [Clostridium botulinum]
MKKIIFADFMEYDDQSNKLGNYHYAKLFSQNGYEVLWMSCPWNILMYIKDKEVYLKRKALSKLTTHKLDKNIYGFAPHARRLYGNHLFCKNANIVLNFEKYITPNIKKSLSKIGFDKVDILWISNPKQYWISNVAEYKKMITRLPDDYSEIGGFPTSINIIEKKLLRKSNVVFGISKNLIDKKKNIREDIVYLPNGAELNNFIRDEYNQPKEFKNNNKRCVYVGAIGHWFDVNLIKYCADKLKNIDFYIIGPVKKDLSILDNSKNIHILGKRNYKDIPDYLYYSDVGLIPFEVNELTDSVSPIKLYEYMSVGLNVVSTNFKEMKYVNSPAYIAKGYEQFCNYIEQAIKNKNTERNISFAKKNTWEKRYNLINKIILR